VQVLEQGRPPLEKIVQGPVDGFKTIGGILKKRPRCSQAPFFDAGNSDRLKTNSLKMELRFASKFLGTPAIVQKGVNFQLMIEHRKSGIPDIFTTELVRRHGR